MFTIVKRIPLRVRRASGAPWPGGPTRSDLEDSSVRCVFGRSDGTYASRHSPAKPAFRGEHRVHPRRSSTRDFPFHSRAARGILAPSGNAFVGAEGKARAISR